jgi:effector-binding domain-containing protein
MKKVLKYCLVGLGCIVVVFLVAGLIQSNEVKVSRSITINTSQKVVVQQFQLYKNWTRWSPWIDADTEAELVYFGEDGKVNSGYSWDGEDVGAGRITTVQSDASSMTFDLKFLKPFESDAKGKFSTEVIIGGEVTNVTWELTMHNQFPWSALNFLSNYFVGKDFEKGLAKMKAYAEENPFTELTYNDITSSKYGGQVYGMVKREVNWSDIEKFSKESFKYLIDKMYESRLGAPTTFYFSWDDQKQKTEMAVAYQLPSDLPISGIEILKIPPSTLYQLKYQGGYGNLARAQQLFQKYILEHNLDVKYNFEEYVIGPSNMPDSTLWMTTINAIVLDN